MKGHTKIHVEYIVEEKCFYNRKTFIWMESIQNQMFLHFKGGHLQFSESPQEQLHMKLAAWDHMKCLIFLYHSRPIELPFRDLRSLKLPLVPMNHNL